MHAHQAIKSHNGPQCRVPLASQSVVSNARAASFTSPTRVCPRACVSQAREVFKLPTKPAVWSLSAEQTIPVPSPRPFLLNSSLVRLRHSPTQTLIRTTSGLGSLPPLNTTSTLSVSLHKMVVNGELPVQPRATGHQSTLVLATRMARPGYQSSRTSPLPSHSTRVLSKFREMSPTSASTRMASIVVQVVATVMVARYVDPRSLSSYRILIVIPRYPSTREPRHSSSHHKPKTNAPVCIRNDLDFLRIVLPASIIYTFFVLAISYHLLHSIGNGCISHVEVLVAV